MLPKGICGLQAATDAPQSQFEISPFPLLSRTKPALVSDLYRAWSTGFRRFRGSPHKASVQVCGGSILEDLVRGCLPGRGLGHRLQHSWWPLGDWRRRLLPGLNLGSPVGFGGFGDCSCLRVARFLWGSPSMGFHPGSSKFRRMHAAFDDNKAAHRGLPGTTL